MKISKHQLMSKIEELTTETQIHFKAGTIFKFVIIIQL